MSEFPSDDRLLTTRDAAAFLGLSAKVIERQRTSGVGPRFIKISDGKSGRVRYAMADIQAWIAQRRREPAASEAEGMAAA